MASNSEALARRRLLAVEVPLSVMEALGPFLGRASLAVELIDQAAAALELLELNPFEGVVVGYPLCDHSFDQFVEEVATQGSPWGRSRLLVVASAERRGELDRYLGGRVAAVVSPSDDPLALQQAVSNLLGVAPRRSARLRVRFDVALGHGERSFSCRTVDLSRTGALLESEVVPAVGARVSFHLMAPDRPVAGWARVVRHALPRFERVSGFAIRFSELEDDGEPRLAALLGNG